MPKVLSHDTLTDDFQMPHPALQLQVKLLVWVIQLPPAQIVTGRRRHTLPAAPPWLLKVLQIQNLFAGRFEKKEGNRGHVCTTEKDAVKHAARAPGLHSQNTFMILKSLS